MAGPQVDGAEVEGGDGTKKWPAQLVLLPNPRQVIPFGPLDALLSEPAESCHSRHNRGLRMSLLPPRMVLRHHPAKPTRPAFIQWATFHVCRSANLGPKWFARPGRNTSRGRHNNSCWEVVPAFVFFLGGGTLEDAFIGSGTSAALSKDNFFFACICRLGLRRLNFIDPKLGITLLHHNNYTVATNTLQYINLANYGPQ